MRNTCLLAAAVLVISGCAGLPRHVEKTRSVAFQEPGTTTLGRIVVSDEVGKNLSGIRLLSSGDEAFASLIALADHAERTLDIQYYIIHEDESTRTLLHHVRVAADRGVRVRVLVDDLNTAGEDRRFMHLSSHANVEVRVFNPFTAARLWTWTRFIASASNIRRINHRMHSKFVDLDVVAAGPIVPALSASFDAFWNSKYAIPIGSVASAMSPEDASAPLVEPDFSVSAGWLEHG